MISLKRGEIGEIADNYLTGVLETDNVVLLRSAIAKAQLKKALNHIEVIAKARRQTSKHRVNYITLSRKCWDTLLKEVE